MNFFATFGNSKIMLITYDSESVLITYIFRVSLIELKGETIRIVWLFILCNWIIGTLMHPRFIEKYRVIN